MGRLTWALIILNVIIFELVFSMPKAMMAETFGLFSFSTPHVLEVWRWITSLFLHASASHLFFNMLGLYFFGRVLEDKIKKKRFLLIYFVSGIAGNLLYGLTSYDPVVGASGCIFGLMGAAMLLKPTERINMYIFPLPLGVVALLFAIVETMLARFPQGISNVAHIAHVAGMVAGGILTFIHRPGEVGKGLVWLVFFIVLLIFLGPFFGVIIDIGSIFLEVVDVAVGFFLYGLAGLIGMFLWGG